MILFKRKKTIRKKILSSILSYRNFLNQDVTEVFIGKKTIFSLLGFSIGGILVGRTRIIQNIWGQLAEGYLQFIYKNDEILG